MALMKPFDRYSVLAFRVLAWVLFLTVCAQSYTIGLFLFGVARFQSHATLGLSAIPVGLMLVISAWGGRRRGAPLGLSLMAFGGLLLQPVLVYFVKPAVPALAALHPLVGVLLVLLAWRIVRRPLSPIT
jgi:hypothetical protein